MEQRWGRGCEAGEDGGAIGQGITLKTERNVSGLYCKDGKRDKEERRWRGRKVLLRQEKKKNLVCRLQWGVLMSDHT